MIKNHRCVREWAGVRLLTTTLYMVSDEMDNTMVCNDTQVVGLFFFILRTVSHILQLIFVETD